MYTHKLCERAGFTDCARQLPSPQVFTNGVFDLLHLGHVRYLQAARQLGASLVVAINSDRSTQMLGKGPGRPVNRAPDRAALVAALQCVDLVTVFDEATPIELLQELRPAIYAKGGDYRDRTLREASLMQQWGGSTVILDYLQGYSSTSMIERAHHICSMEKLT